MNTPEAMSAGRPDTGAGYTDFGAAPRATTPRSDAERIDHILITMRRTLAQLEGIGPVDLELLEVNPTAGLVIERVLANLGDMAFDINCHVSRAMSGTAPETFAESCEAAVEFGLIDAELASALMPAEGPYHVAMQLYLDREPVKVEAVVGDALSAFQEFERRAQQWRRDRAEGATGT
ncbi:hypothetical protein ACFYVR_05880 [Rhodococcus sp. NPDC003318]|uniref:hypothetical protein n=1 Tax=Rhodococcus sp. NPDC003318 TaxID=3364503 RepID=UPI0036C39FB5